MLVSITTLLLMGTQPIMHHRSILRIGRILAHQGQRVQMINFRHSYNKLLVLIMVSILPSHLLHLITQVCVELIPIRIEFFSFLLKIRFNWQW